VGRRRQLKMPIIDLVIVQGVSPGNWGIAGKAQG
jgi:hypothetical protein